MSSLSMAGIWLGECRSDKLRDPECCGGRMIVIETFEGLRPARSPSPTPIRIDTS
jgi:hypothetical protein